MSFVFSQRSLNNLKGVHPDLVSVAYEALGITKMDFIVIDGLRTLEEQRVLVNKGKSWTMDSRHLTGHAIDIVPYPVSWDWEDFYPVADAFIRASHRLNIPIRWGGNWNVKDVRRWHGTSKLLNQKYKGKAGDAPHFELPRGFYPA